MNTNGDLMKPRSETTSAGCARKSTLTPLDWHSTGCTYDNNKKAFDNNNNNKQMTIITITNN